MRTRSLTVVVVKIPGRLNVESAMSETQFDRLLDAVRSAIESRSHRFGRPNHPLKATNDNLFAWPLMPFPEGWYAAQ